MKWSFIFVVFPPTLEGSELLLASLSNFIELCMLVQVELHGYFTALKGIWAAVNSWSPVWCILQMNL